MKGFKIQKLRSVISFAVPTPTKGVILLHHPGKPLFVNKRRGKSAKMLFDQQPYLLSYWQVIKTICSHCLESVLAGANGHTFLNFTLIAESIFFVNW